jgi:hypothetical protein
MPSDVIALASFYLAIVGLLVSIFFLNLTEWFNSTLALASKWKVFSASQDRLREPQYYEKRLDLFSEATHLSTVMTVVSWLLLSAFMAYIMCLMNALGSELDAKAQVFLHEYLKRPTYTFFALYLVTSVIMLAIGYGKARGVLRSVSKTV